MTKQTKDIMNLAAMIVLLLLLLIAGPLMVIWALNTIFPILAIPYNFWTWLAVVVLHGSFTQLSIRKKYD